MTTIDGPRAYALGELSLKHEGTPSGTITEAVLPPGDVYPGIAHHYSVYRPAIGEGPFPLTVFLDRMAFRYVMSPIEALDNLIAQGLIPPMVAVFVDPGMTPPGAAGQQLRWDRGYEYDGVSDRLATFLEEELLPAVARVVEISDDPELHAILGASSSAPGAFVSAWLRPDLFRRVATFVGSYVGLRGAEVLSALVRKGEARPLKVWMQCARFDHRSAAQPYGTYYAGSWVLGNEAMKSALQFRGYDVEFTLGDGAHDLEHAAERLPYALAWLWNDDKPIRVSPPDALHAEGWEVRGSIWDLVDDMGGTWELLDDGGSGTAKPILCAAGDTITADNAAGVVEWHREDGSIVVATMDATITGVTSNGTDLVYVAGYDAAGGFVARIDAEGRIARTPLPIQKTAGFAIGADLGQLSVCDPASRFQWNLIIDSEGMPSAPAPYYMLDELERQGGARDVAVDTLGRTYFATKLGVQVCEPIGRVEIALLPPVPGAWVDALWFGGEGRRDLIVECAGGRYRRRLSAIGSIPTEPTVLEQPLL